MNLVVEVPYTTNPRMVKNQGPIFNPNPQSHYIKEKINQFSKFGNELYAETQECRINQLVEKFCELFSLPIKNNIKDFALYFEEDVAILYRGYLSAVCFCFPSGWVPADKIGLKLSEIHTAVADSEKLVAASDRIASTISNPELGSFYRQVWTITVNGELSNHPATRINKDPKSINDLYLRTETQTTAPLGDGLTSLFFVKVEVKSLSEVWPILGQQIKSSVNSMSDAILKYKHLENIKPLLNRVVLM